MSTTVPGVAADALTPATRLIGATVTGSDGESVGTVTELMLTTAPGTITYLALSVGGIAGIGERMFAVPWSAVTVDPIAGTLSVAFAREELDGRDGFDKDAWPVAGDPTLAR